MTISLRADAHKRNLMTAILFERGRGWGLKERPLDLNINAIMMSDRAKDER